MAKILLRGNTPADQLIEINRPNHMYVFKPCEGGHVGNVEDKADIEAFQSMGGEIVKDAKEAPKPAAKAEKPVDTQADTAEIELTGAEAVAKAKEEPEKKEKKAVEKKVKKPPKRGGK